MVAARNIIDMDVLVPVKTNPHSGEEQQQYNLVTMLPGISHDG
jgi:hypothetical protein